MTEPAETAWITAPYLKVVQPVGEFYVVVIQGSDLARITFTDTRHLESADREDDFARYVGIQRPLNKKRLPELRAFVKQTDAAFPSSIIIAVSSNDVEISDQNLRIRDLPQVATVIDGQHRVAALSGNHSRNFQVIATVFVDMSMEMKAHIFSTINMNQTRINPSLAKDLLEFSRLMTPEKVVHHIAQHFHSDPNSPWFGMIKMLGTKEGAPKGMLTQHTFVDKLVSLIYNPKDREQLRSDLQRARGNRQRLDEDRYPAEVYPLFTLYRNGEDPHLRMALDNFFSAVQDAFPDEWGNPQSILTKTTGFHAMVEVLRLAARRGVRAGDLSRSYFDRWAKGMKQALHGANKKLNSIDFKPGATGSLDLERLWLAALTEQDK